MLRCGVVSLFPEMFRALTDFGITGRAVQQGNLELTCCNPRDFSDNAYQSVDDRPYGGGPGMVMMAPPLGLAVNHLKERLGGSTKVIAMSPQGKQVDQNTLRALAEADYSPLFVAGRYEGMDERFVDQFVDEEWSIGDYVLSGGELAIMVILDAAVRWIPGVLGHGGSAMADSFAEGLLDCPQYTRPAVFNGQGVPEVLLSGDHKAIEEWRLAQRLSRTWQRRPDLLKNLELSSKEQNLLSRSKLS